MKIALFNDLPVQPGFGSGAELSSLAFMREGTRREHVVDCYTPQTTNRGFDSYDLAVIKNVTAFSEVQLDEILKVPTVHWPSDYLMCKWRLFYAMQEKCKKCEGADKAGDIISQSILNVFLSPLHKAAYEFVFPEIKTSGLNTHLSPPFVDPDVFKPIEGVPREENTAIGVNALLDFKGGENVLAYAEEHPEIVFNMFGGPSNNPVLPDNLLYIGRALQEALPALYSQASHYIELPNTPQPFNRTVVEAVLCGVENLIVNENVGAFSYPWLRKLSRTTVEKEMRKTLPELWSKIEGLI